MNPFWESNYDKQATSDSYKPGKVVHTFDPSPWEVEADGSLQDQGQSGTHSHFQVGRD